MSSFTKLGSQWDGGPHIALVFVGGARSLRLTRRDVTAPWHSLCRKEERRRLGWSIWELDVFAAAIGHRRPTVDKRNMQDILSVSDGKWFSNTPYVIGVCYR
ncbi:uncharacterized protein N7506_006880 [Penicillium brevicompactum]|uniref:uncharacterized protein n=1 Tax=Penicillium brevicompactum TaxID=5074 RepID=UPI002542698C|nr:uncharacterized protein N7506_006880 [Penicillium brevicompactum]KAJ5333097.1 hypothetical protein N7506_006880 [Penicillium brevicompactum]